jgi:hypothetical protein
VVHGHELDGLDAALWDVDDLRCLFIGPEVATGLVLNGAGGVVGVSSCLRGPSRSGRRLIGSHHDRGHVIPRA